MTWSFARFAEQTTAVAWRVAQEEGAVVLQACWGQGDIWIRVFYPCTAVVGSGVGSSLSWQEGVFTTDTVEKR